MCTVNRCQIFCFLVTLVLGIVSLSKIVADVKKWNMCRGGCRAASEQVGGTLQQVDPIVKELSLKPFYFMNMLRKKSI